MRQLPVRAGLVLLIGLVIATQAALAVTVNLTPSKDNTLYEDAAGAQSNGAGSHVFVGRTAINELRRTAIAFDIAGNIPADATIDSVTLTMNMSRTIVGPEIATLHRAVADWGEGASDAPGQEGIGAPPAPGDATWLHRFFDTSVWGTPGGDFSATASASQTIDQNGPYTWGSTAGMIDDVQSWLDNPGSNFGWIVLGEEGTSLPTAKRFDSRESVGTGPVLTVDFTTDGGGPGPDPTGIPTVSEWGLFLMLLLLLSAGTILFGQRRALLAGANQGFDAGAFTRPPLAAGLFFKTLVAVAGFAMVALLTTFALAGEVAAVDVTGTVLCVPVLAYLIHLWLAPRKE
jgi:hypothetical protein